MRRMCQLLYSAAAATPATIALPLILSACVVLPTHLADQEPYREEVIGFIEAGSTIKEEIQKQLGVPFEKFGGDRWWVYKASQKMTEWIIVDYESSERFGGESRPHHLLLQFGDEEKVRQIVTLKGNSQCDADRQVCYTVGFLDELVPVPQLDTVVETGQCAVVLYAWKPESPLTGVWVQIDNEDPSIRLTPNAGYKRVNLSIGQHELTAKSDLSWGLFVGTINLTCNSGETYFLRFLHEIVKEASFSVVPAAVALEEVRLRKRIFAQERDSNWPYPAPNIE